MKLLNSFSLFFLFPILLCAQNQMEVGLLLGYSNYMGDVVEPTFTFQQSSFAAGLLARKQLNPNFNLRTNLIYAKLYGDDRYYERLAQRQNRFTSTILEFTLLGEYDLLGKRRYQPEQFKKILSPYFFLGIGLILQNPQVTFGNPTDKDMEAAFSNVQPSVPIGFGLKKDITEYIYISLDWGMRITFSDYLDGIKLSGNPNNNDVYFLGGLTVNYRFDSNKVPESIGRSSTLFDTIEIIE